MSKLQKWIKILGHVESPGVSVRIGDKLERLTDTQACRLDQISGGHSPADVAVDCGVQIPADDLCSLIEASLMSDTGERSVLEAAASNRIALYVDAKGLLLSYLENANAAAETDYRPMTSGHLVLTVASCKELAANGRTHTTSLLLPSAAGGIDTVVTLRSPLSVSRATVQLRKSQLGGIPRSRQSAAR